MDDDPQLVPAVRAPQWGPGVHTRTFARGVVVSGSLLMCGGALPIPGSLAAGLLSSGSCRDSSDDGRLTGGLVDS